MSNPLHATLFGSCLVRRPIRSAARAKDVLGYDGYGPLPALHSFGEMIQAIEVLRGQKTIPQDLWPLCHVKRNFGGEADPAIVTGLDLALIEPSLPVDLLFRGHFINRDAIKQLVLRPIVEKASGNLPRQWMQKGLMDLDEAARKKAAEELGRYIEGDDEESARARTVLFETRALPADLAMGFRRMKEMLACPIGAVVYTFRVMPDGRPVSWPPGFREAVIAAAGAENLPMFETTGMIRTFGVDKAFSRDMRHYSDAFEPVVGEALLQFAEKICATARAGA